MNTSALVVILLMWLPWRVEWLPVAGQAEIICHWAPPSGFPERIGWHDGAVHVVHCNLDQETTRRLSHEMQHYLATKNKLGNWDKFANLVMKEMRRGDFTRHQRLAAKGMIAYGGGYELHAELPMMVHGEIPAAFQPWYPWFDLER